jgi:hypothetical protein
MFEALKTRMGVWLLNHTPNCAEMSRLASRRLEQPPSLRLRLRMALHYFICVWCRRYSKHLQFLHRAAPRLDDRAGNAITRGLSAEAKQRMIERLKIVESES